MNSLYFPIYITNSEITIRLFGDIIFFCGGRHIFVISNFILSDINLFLAGVFFYIIFFFLVMSIFCSGKRRHKYVFVTSFFWRYIYIYCNINFLAIINLRGDNKFSGDNIIYFGGGDMKMLFGIWGGAFLRCR